LPGSVPIAFSYSRVSSGQQLKGRGLGRQADMARAWCEKNNHALDTELDLSDEGRSAYKGDHLAKGALGRFLKLAQQKQLGDSPVLLIEAIDRLSRQEPLDALQSVVFALVTAGVRIVDLEDDRSYDRESLQGDGLIMLVLKTKAAHEYSKRLGRRLSDHWESAREGMRDGTKVHRGGRGGRHPFWLQLSPSGDEWELVEERAAVVRLVFDLLGEGGLSRAATELNQRGIPSANGKGKWAAEGVQRLVRDPATYGALRLNRFAHEQQLKARAKWKKAKKAAEKAGEVFTDPEPEVIEPELVLGHYPAVVSPERWHATQDKLSQRTHAPLRSAADRPTALNAFQGMTFCEKGSLLGVTHSNPQRSSIRHYLRCRARLNGKRCNCSSKGWHLPAVHCHLIRRLGEGVLVFVDRYRAEPVTGDVLETKAKAASQELAEAKNKLATAQRALDQAIDGGAALTLMERLNAKVDQCQQEAEKAKQWLEECQARLSVEATKIRPQDLLTATPALELMRKIIRANDSLEDRSALNALVREIGFRATFDGSDPDNPRIGIEAPGIPIQWERFHGDSEAGLLAMKTLVRPRQQKPGPLHIGR
jgi:DNA invertase Pin-like site-specific DNA recombinase